MNLKNFVSAFVPYFLLVFVISATVIYLWNLIFHGHGAFAWGTSLVLGIVAGIFYPLMGKSQKGRKAH